jgi:hypothetical protein
MKAFVSVPIKYGSIAALLGSAILVALYYMDRHPFLIPVFVDYRLILFSVFVFFTLREVRDYFQGGIMYFWQGIFASFIFTVTFAVLSSLILLIFMSAVPEFLSDYIALSIEQLRLLPPQVIESIGKDVYNRNLELLPATNVADLAFLYFWQSFMISLFISIILSVILRRQPKP